MAWNDYGKAIRSHDTPHRAKSTGRPCCCSNLGIGAHLSVTYAGNIPADLLPETTEVFQIERQGKLCQLSGKVTLQLFCSLRRIPPALSRFGISSKNFLFNICLTKTGKRENDLDQPGLG